MGVSRPRSWSHLLVLGAIFVGVYRQILTTSLKIDFEIPPRRALDGTDYSQQKDLLTSTTFLSGQNGRGQRHGVATPSRIITIYHALHDGRPALSKSRRGTNLPQAEAARQRPPSLHGRLASVVPVALGVFMGQLGVPFPSTSPSLLSPALSPQSLRANNPCSSPGASEAKQLPSRTISSSAWDASAVPARGGTLQHDKASLRSDGVVPGGFAFRRLLVLIRMGQRSKSFAGVGS